MKKNRFIPLFFFLLFFILTPGFSKEDKISFTSHQNEAKLLVNQFFTNQTIYNQYSAQKQKYLNSDAGWENASGEKGFFIDGFNFYFRPGVSGFARIDSKGKQKGYFQIRKQENGIWMDFSNAQTGSLTAGYKEKSSYCFALFLTFSDGIRIEIWEDTITVKLSDKEYYQLYFFNQEPKLFQSPALRDKIYCQKPDQALIMALKEDFSSFYEVQVLQEALKQNIDLSSDQEAGLFAVNWLRRKVGLPEIQSDEKLSLAAANHAEYLLVNGIIERMMSWDTNSVDMNSYLALHNETKGMPGFTGETVTQRTEHTGAGSQTGENATFGGLNAIQENIAWFLSIYHRRPYMDFRVNRFGHGRAEGNLEKLETSCIANFHYSSKTSSSYYVYPYSGSQDIPCVFANFESPAPFADSKPKGVPITIFFQDSKYKESKLFLFGPRGEVDLLTSSVLAAQDNFIEAVPAAPLSPGTAYTLEFHYSGNVDTITFTTASINPAEKLAFQLKQDLKWP